MNVSSDLAIPLEVSGMAPGFPNTVQPIVQTLNSLAEVTARAGRAPSRVALYAADYDSIARAVAKTIHGGRLDRPMAWKGIVLEKKS